MPTVAQEHEEWKPRVLTFPFAFSGHPPPAWGKLTTSYYPSSQLPCSLPSLISFSGSSEVSLAVTAWSVLARRSQAGWQHAAHTGLSYKPDSLPHSRAVWLVQLVLLCFASRGSCSVQEGCETPLVALSSASLCTPILVFNVCVTVETGKNIRCVQPASFCPSTFLFHFIFILNSCVSCQVETKSILPLPRVCWTLLPLGQLSARYTLLLSVPSSSYCLYLNTNQLVFFETFRNLESKGRLRFACLEEGNSL